MPELTSCHRARLASCLALAAVIGHAWSEVHAASPPASPDASGLARLRIAQANVWPQPDKPSNSKPPAPAGSQAKSPPRPAPQPPAATRTIPVPADVGNLSQPQNPEPVLHARNAGLGPCIGAVERGAAEAINAPHSAFSNWNPGAPAQHAFESIVIQNYQGTLAPRAASVLLATPSANGCDASTIQVFPSARPCADIEKDISKSARLLGKLAGLPLFGTEANEHRVLLPSAGNGCVIVAIRVQYVAPSGSAQPAPPPK